MQREEPRILALLPLASEVQEAPQLARRVLPDRGRRMARRDQGIDRLRDLVAGTDGYASPSPPRAALTSATRSTKGPVPSAKETVHMA